ncbi:MAG TPA: LysM peptidoglycan-binding domain-containing protein [Flavobacterium sp.]|jgi:LysM repeat protein
MRQFFLALIPALFFALNVSAQDNYIKHKVAKAETVTQIAKKYKVTPFDIYRLNPDAQSGIKENEVLLIPSSADATPSNTTVSAALQRHLVKPGETLFSIARDFNVSVKDLQNANVALLKDGLKSGQTISIPGGSTTPREPVTRPVTVVEMPAPASNAASTQYHIVEPGQTKFSIAKKYGMTVAELDRKNPNVGANLPAGYRLVVGGTAATSAPTPTGSVTSTVSPGTKIAYANYEVKPKETLYSLSQMFGITTEELIALNPNLQDGVKVGMILKVPGKGSIIMETPAGYVDLTKSLNTTQRKELVMLLPFNASKIQGDSVRSITERLKKDQFLNLTLDFYSGALMAIDSAKALGLNVNVRIFDSAESKYSSGVSGIIQSNNVRNADAVIGPFYQQYLETTAEALAKDSVAVISPLSKDSGKPFRNLYQSMPTENFLKSAMFNYMLSKGGNIIVVSDPKKAANRQFIMTNYKQAQFAQLSETGGFVPENVKKLLVKDKTNYVVLDSERTGMILATTNLLLNEVNNYKIQLAIIESNATLDFEEISLKRLTLLKMLYPSVTRDNNSEQALAFANAYREKNKVFPSQYATRGFDVTFDTLLRLSQDKTFEECMGKDKSEQIESRFNYIRDNQGGFVNKGVYILQYNEDLSITEAQ